jgi:hypothetical protein
VARGAVARMASVAGEGAVAVTEAGKGDTHLSGVSI